MISMTYNFTSTIFTIFTSADENSLQATQQKQLQSLEFSEKNLNFQKLTRGTE